MMLLLRLYVIRFRQPSLAARRVRFRMQPSDWRNPLWPFLAFFLCRRVDDVNDRATLAPIAVVSLRDGAFRWPLQTSEPRLSWCHHSLSSSLLQAWIRYLAACATLGVVLAVAFIAMKPYRLISRHRLCRQRSCAAGKIDPAGHVLSYARKTASTSDPGYQQTQANIARRLRRFSRCRPDGEQAEDALSAGSAHRIIYAVVGEETGFLGAAVLLAGFVVIFWRGYGFRCAPTIILAAISP